MLSATCSESLINLLPLSQATAARATAFRSKLAEDMELLAQRRRDMQQSVYGGGNRAGGDSGNRSSGDVYKGGISGGVYGGRGGSGPLSAGDGRPPQHPLGTQQATSRGGIPPLSTPLRGTDGRIVHSSPMHQAASAPVPPSEITLAAVALGSRTADATRSEQRPGAVAAATVTKQRVSRGPRKPPLAEARLSGWEAGPCPLDLPMMVDMQSLQLMGAPAPAVTRPQQSQQRFPETTMSRGPHSAPAASSRPQQRFPETAASRDRHSAALMAADRAITTAAEAMYRLTGGGGAAGSEGVYRLAAGQQRGGAGASASCTTLAAGDSIRGSGMGGRRAASLGSDEGGAREGGGGSAPAPLGGLHGGSERTASGSSSRNGLISDDGSSGLGVAGQRTVSGGSTRGLMLPPVVAPSSEGTLRGG